MLNWFRKPPVCDHAADVQALKIAYANVETRLTALEINEKVFRDKVLRKIQKPQMTETASEPAQTEDFYNRVLVKE